MNRFLFIFSCAREDFDATDDGSEKKGSIIECLIYKVQSFSLRMGISQAALSQMEAEGKRLRKVMLEKLVAAMGIGIEQLR